MFPIQDQRFGGLGQLPKHRAKKSAIVAVHQADALTPLWSVPEPTAAAALAALAAITTGYTTSQLARQLGISPASASEHTTVLRSAGLMASVRYRNTVHHILTHLATPCLPAIPDDGLLSGTSPVARSVRLGGFSERHGDARRGLCVESEFVVAPAEILDEGVPSDDHLSCAVGA